LAFTPGLPAVLFYFAYALWLGSELAGAVLIPRRRRRGKAKVKRDRGSAILIGLSVFISVSVTFNFGILNIGPLPDWVFYPGILLMILGVVIRQYAIAVLGRFFSLTVRVAEDHRVVDKGPYYLVRHPSYTGVMLTFIGLGLAVQSWPATLILLLVFALAYGYRMLVEEKILTTQLGQEYIDYMRRTKRLIPFLI
jgi:protein-S-isoprenylcysteine O-methyltransferase Ste14